MATCRRAGAAAALVLALAATLSVPAAPASGAAPAGAAPAAPAAPSALPRSAPPGARSAVPDSARQVVVVTATSWQASRGALRAYRRDPSGSWTQVLGPVPAWLGRHGLAPAATRRQGSGTTPAGAFRLPWAFGRLPDPGTVLPYRRFDRDDVWPYDPRDRWTYNVLQVTPAAGRWRAGYVERLWRLRDQYRYVAVVDYNLPPQPYRLGPAGLRLATVPADTRRGGGIFLHVDDGRPTAGCVGVSLVVMRQLLRWLHPAQDPYVVIGVAGGRGRPAAT